MMLPMHRFLTLGLLASFLLGLAGCDADKPVNVANLTGAWQGRFADTAVTFSLYGDGTFKKETNPDEANEAGTQMYFGSGFTRTGEIGMWRLLEDEIVFYNDEGTTGGLLVAKITSSQVVLKTVNEDQVLFFSSVPLVGTTSGFKSMKDLEAELEEEMELEMDDEDTDEDDTDADAAPTTQPAE
ncbi:MAG: hypothetical protein AAF561_11115 [Planctomycetota bacterium]